MWDSINGRESLALHGHKAEVKSVAYSPDGERLATASDDQTAKVWDAATGQELLTLRGHTARFTVWPIAPMASASPPPVMTTQRRCGTPLPARSC